MPTLSLKAQNAASLVSLVVISLASAWLIAHGVEQLAELKSSVELLGGIAVISPLVVLLTNLVPADIKHMLVFYRYKNTLPGHRFIQLVDKDPRISLSTVVRQFEGAELPGMSNEEQNNFWYREIYRPNQNDTQVKSAHKSFLLYRDAGAAVLLLAMAAIPLYLFNILILNKQVSVVVPIVLLGVAVSLMFAASLAGKRMITSAVCAQLYRD